MSVVHRVRLPAGATVLVEKGHAVEPAEVLATHRAPGDGVSVPVAARLRRPPAEVAGMVDPRPGARLEAGELLASGHGRDVLVAEDCLYLGYDRDDGTALVAPLGSPRPVIGHVRGEVASVSSEAIELRVAGALLSGVGGTGGAVHGPLAVVVRSPSDELRATAIDVGAAGRILVGGSRASAETLTRARAMGAAGIVLGGVLDKELRDFEATQARRRESGAPAGDFSVMIVEGFGKVGLDAELFSWFTAHEGHVASLFGLEARLYVYDASPPPGRRAVPRPGDRVIGLRRPYGGAGGELIRIVDGSPATEAGITARSALVRFEDGRTAIVPIANLAATERHPGS